MIEREIFLNFNTEDGEIDKFIYGILVDCLKESNNEAQMYVGDRIRLKVIAEYLPEDK